MCRIVVTAFWKWGMKIEITSYQTDVKQIYGKPGKQQGLKGKRKKIRIIIRILNPEAKTRRISK